jgi:hypothetical protein
MLVRFFTPPNVGFSGANQSQLLALVGHDAKIARSSYTPIRSLPSGMARTLAFMAARARGGSVVSAGANPSGPSPTSWVSAPAQWMPRAMLGRLAPR